MFKFAQLQLKVDAYIRAFTRHRSLKTLLILFVIKVPKKKNNNSGPNVRILKRLYTYYTKIIILSP